MAMLAADHRQALVAVVSGPNKEGSTSLLLDIIAASRRDSTVVVFDLDPTAERSATKRLVQNRFKLFPDFVDWAQLLKAGESSPGISTLRAEACAFPAKAADAAGVFVVPCYLDATNANRGKDIFKAQLGSFVDQAHRAFAPADGSPASLLILFDLPSPSELPHPLTQAIFESCDFALLCQNAGEPHLATQALLQPSKPFALINGDGVAHGFVL